jgi:hypothetical protein
MNRRLMIQLEPFAEVVSDAYRFGYRALGADDCCLSTIDVPTSIVEQAVLTRASLAARVGPDGTVISYMLMPHVRDSVPDIPTDVASIDALVQGALNVENLRREEATITDLSMLLRRLEDSVSLVKGAISQMKSGERRTSG